MMAQLGLSDGDYLSDQQRQIAADVSRAFDNSRDIQERTMQRYQMPALANYDKDWAIERARAMVDRTNRIRPLNAQQKSGRDIAGGVMRLLPLLMGRDGVQGLMQKGLIKYAQDAYGNWKAVPDYQAWLDKNSFTTAEGNLAIIGEDGQLRIVDPKTGDLLENVGTDWSKDANGDISFNSDIFNADNQYNVGGAAGYTEAPATDMSSWYDGTTGDMTSAAASSIADTDIINAATSAATDASTSEALDFLDLGAFF
jgi:hypothetical protein